MLLLRRSLLRTGGSVFVFSSVILLVFLFLTYSSSESRQHLVAAQPTGEEAPEFKELLKSGDKLVMLGRGSYADAVAKFSAALAMVPNSPKALYRRAELLYLTRQFDESLRDLDQVLKLDPMHRRALETRIKANEQQGRINEAVEDYDRLSRVYAKMGDHAKASSTATEGTRRKMTLQEWKQLEPQLATLKKLEPGKRRGIAEHCVKTIRDLIAVSGGGSKVDLRLKAAECAVLGRLHTAATDELNLILKLESSNLAASALHAQQLRSLGSMERARAEIRRCLRLDPEYKPCMQLHRSMKKLTTSMELVERHIAEKEWKEALAEIDSMLGWGSDEAPNVEQLWRWKCEGYAAHLRDVKKGFEACDMVIDLESQGGDKNPQLADPYLWRADLHLLGDDTAKAEEDIRKAADVNPQGEKVREYQQKIEKIKKGSARKDYYSILGVSKTASNSEIRKAYRKVSRDLHPDVLRSKEMTESERARADKQYRDINEAKEILMSDDKRKRYDAGEDPANPQPGHGGNPFGGGGGGQNFHFSFNGGHGFPGGGFPGGGMPGGFQFNF